MDYEFTYDEYDNPIAIFTSGFEALGRWLSEELCQHPHIDEMLDIIDQLEQRRIQRRVLIGYDAQLEIDRDEVSVVANLAQEPDYEHELPEGTSPYDDESNAACGLYDFKSALLAWQDFIPPAS